MKIAIHQPEHFPYLGFFYKMSQADLFVVLDDVQYKKNNFQNRNWFFNTTREKEWFTIELEPKPHRKDIKDVTVCKNKAWRSKILKKLRHNFKQDYGDIYDSDQLTEINLRSIKYSMKHLSIKTPLVLSSEMNITTSKTQRLVDICKGVGATQYISGIGGKDYLELELFEKNNIELCFSEYSPINYCSAVYNIYHRIGI